MHGPPNPRATANRESELTDGGQFLVLGHVLLEHPTVAFKNHALFNDHHRGLKVPKHPSRRMDFNPGLCKNIPFEFTTDYNAGNMDVRLNPGSLPYDECAV